MSTWQDTVVAVSTAVYATVTALLLFGVLVAYLQLRALRRGQQLDFLGSSLREYRTEEMMVHLREFIDWAREHGEEGPRLYCVGHREWSKKFQELHNHRRQISQFVAGVALPVYQGLVNEKFVIGLMGVAIDSCRFLIGLEWRVIRQLIAWDGRSETYAFHRWPLMELFIAYSASRRSDLYRRFKRKSWLTPLRFVQRARESNFEQLTILPRYRAFLELLSQEPGYGVWARAALRAVDEHLTPEESTLPARFRLTHPDV